MSNVQLFNNGGQLPAHLRRGELSQTTKALMGNSSKRISIEGGVFRMIVGGEEVAKNEERAMNVIVVRAADKNSRTYYAGTYVKGTKARPACWSDDAEVPHPDVKNPQSPKCATCPQNIKGSGQGENTRACRYQRRLAVLLENDVNGDIYAMSIPAASVFDSKPGRNMGLQQYARFLGGHGIDINAVVTELRFDTDSTAPKLLFSAARPLDETEWRTVMARRDEQAALDAVTMTVAQLDDTPETPAAAPAPAPAAAPAPALAPTRAAAARSAGPGGFVVSKTAEPVPEPTVRESNKPAMPDVNSILQDWATDD
jgi:hypothetical protein